MDIAAHCHKVVKHVNNYIPYNKLLTPPRSLEVNKSSVEEESFSVSIDIIQC